MEEISFPENDQTIEISLSLPTPVYSTFSARATLFTFFLFPFFLSFLFFFFLRARSDMTWKSARRFHVRDQNFLSPVERRAFQERGDGKRSAKVGRRSENAISRWWWSIIGRPSSSPSSFSSLIFPLSLFLSSFIDLENFRNTIHFSFFDRFPPPSHASKISEKRAGEKNWSFHFPFSFPRQRWFSHRTCVKGDGEVKKSRRETEGREGRGREREREREKTFSG